MFKHFDLKIRSEFIGFVSGKNKTNGQAKQDRKKKKNNKFGQKRKQKNILKK